MNYKVFEKAIKRLVNKEFTVDSENFDRFEIDILNHDFFSPFRRCVFWVF